MPMMQLTDRSQSTELTKYFAVTYGSTDSGISCPTMYLHFRSLFVLHLIKIAHLKNT